MVKKKIALSENDDRIHLEDRKAPSEINLFEKVSMPDWGGDV